MQVHLQVLIFGASYGSLFATKLLLAAHSVKLVCPAAAAELINSEGTRVSLPVRGRDCLIEVDSQKLPGKLSADVPDNVDPGAFDLVVLAMQEPQYRAPEIRKLLAAVGAARIPCLSIMNMPPLPYLSRIPTITIDPCRAAYTDASVWDVLDPALITWCSADPQASRVPDRPDNVIQVRLPTNFRAARFESDLHTGMLQRLAADVEAARFDGPSGKLDLPVKLKVHDSIFVPLSKWPMLLAGNYRCITRNGMRTIDQSVHSDLAASRSLYEWVCELCCALGAEASDLVPFDRYAEAAATLTVPSSAARSLSGGAPQIERVDRLVQAIAAQRGAHLAALDDLVSLVDTRLEVNRSRHPA